MQVIFISEIKYKRNISLEKNDYVSILNTMTMKMYIRIPRLKTKKHGFTLKSQNIKEPVGI